MCYILIAKFIGRAKHCLPACQEQVNKLICINDFEVFRREKEAANYF